MIRALLTALLTATALGCDGRSQRLVITGSSTVAPLLSEIAKRFEQIHPELRIDVQTGGSSRGIADVRRELAQIGMVSRPLHASESDLLPHTIAMDGLCLIVHRDNPVRRLTDAQVVSIYRGEIDRWSRVGGSESPIVVVNKAEGRATLELFVRHFGIRAGEIAADVVIGDNEQGIKTVAGNPAAIGYVSVGTAEFNLRDGTPIAALAAQGIEATLQNVRNGSFPIQRPLNLVTRGAPTDRVKEFIDFARSSRVHDLLDAHYLAPPAP